MRYGPFPSVAEVEGMVDLHSKLTPTRAERFFREGDVFAPDMISELLDGINEAFITCFLCDGELIGGFGSMNERFTNAMDKYKIMVLNVASTWQIGYESVHGSLDAELQGRLAYALKYDIYGKVPRPILTSGFVLALCALFERIPSVISEVSDPFALHFLYGRLRTTPVSQYLMQVWGLCAPSPALQPLTQCGHWAARSCIVSRIATQGFFLSHSLQLRWLTHISFL